MMVPPSFEHACRLGEGIVSKRHGRAYRSGQCRIEARSIGLQLNQVECHEGRILTAAPVPEGVEA
jgi:hypothetical protein